MVSPDARLLGLQEEELFEIEQSQLDQIEVTLSESDFEGIILEAPKEVDLARQSLPVLLAWQQSGLRAWEVTDASNMSLLLTSLDTGATQAIALLESPKDLDIGGLEPRERPPKPTGASATAKVTRTGIYAAEALFNLSEVGQKVSLTAIAWNWAAEPVTVNLNGRSSVQPDLQITPSRRSGDLPKYEPGSPEDTLSARIEMNAAQGPVVIGNFALPYDPELFVADGGVLVPATFAVFKRDVPVPWLIDLTLPAYGRIEEGSVLTGAFSIELGPLIKVDLLPGEYVGYLLMNGRISNPAILSI